MKSVQIQSFFWSVFSRIRTEYREILRIPPYSVRMRENTDQKNSVLGHFSHSAWNTDSNRVMKENKAMTQEEI